MRLWAVVVIAVLWMGGAATAQDVDFGQRTVETRLTAIGGFLLGWLTLDLDETNAVLEQAGYPGLGELVLMRGGGGSGSARGNIALGGLGLSGTTDAIQGGRSVALEVGFSGVTLDWVTRPAEQLLIGVGAVLGGGSATLTARRRFADDVEDALTTPTTTYLNAGFFGGMGMIRVRVGITRGIWLEGWGGYLLGFPGRWQDEDRALAGPSVPAQGPVFGVGISFGGSARAPTRGPAEPSGPERERPEELPEEDDEEPEADPSAHEED